VARIEADYLSPARFDDTLEVHTSVQRIGGARVVLEQRVTRHGQVLFASVVTLVALDAQGRATRLPAEFRRTAR